MFPLFSWGFWVVFNPPQSIHFKNIPVFQKKTQRVPWKIHPFATPPCLELHSQSMKHTFWANGPEKHREITVEFAKGEGWVAFIKNEYKWYDLYISTIYIGLGPCKSYKFWNSEESFRMFLLHKNGVSFFFLEIGILPKLAKAKCVWAQPGEEHPNVSKMMPPPNPGELCIYIYMYNLYNLKVNESSKFSPLFFEKQVASPHKKRADFCLLGDEYWRQYWQTVCLISIGRYNGSGDAIAKSEGQHKRPANCKMI